MQNIKKPHFDGAFFWRRNRKLKLKQLMQATMVFWRIEIFALYFHAR